MSRRSLAALLAIALMLPFGASAGSGRADVALVLAIDVSGSVDNNRFKLQREGVAAALESEEVAAAVSSGVNQTIEIAVVEWAEEQRLLVPWTVLRGQDDLKALAARLRGASRSWVHTMTDPGGGIAAAEHLFAAEPLAGLRQVIDVSGDGRQNTGEVATADARDAAVSHGITVNGLPIASEGEPGIEDWYRANVVGGPGAFLVVADSDDAFAAAFRQKLTFEISTRGPRKRGRPEGLPDLSAESRLLRLLHFEDPNDATLGHVVAKSDIGLCQGILNALGIDAPAGLDGDVLGTVDLIGDGSPGNSRIGLLLP
jgi:hypothetical protein